MQDSSEHVVAALKVKRQTLDNLLNVGMVEQASEEETFAIVQEALKAGRAREIMIESVMEGLKPLFDEHRFLFWFYHHVDLDQEDGGGANHDENMLRLLAEYTEATGQPVPEIAERPYAPTPERPVSAAGDRPDTGTAQPADPAAGDVHARGPDRPEVSVADREFIEDWVADHPGHAAIFPDRPKSPPGAGGGGAGSGGDL